MRVVLAHGSVFLFIAAFAAYYGQLHRTRSGDSYGTVYTAVAIVEHGTIRLDRYLRAFQERSSLHPYQLVRDTDGHLVNRYPIASALAAVPAVAVLAATGTTDADWDTWMEAGMLTASLLTALSVAVLFVALTRLTTRERAMIAAIAYGFGTIAWPVAAQALAQHAGAMLMLCLGLLALVDRRFALAGAALAAMVAFRTTTPVIAVCLLPLVGRSARDWGRFALGALPVGLAVGAYNTAVFGSWHSSGYTATRVGGGSETLSGSFLHGLLGNLVAPGRGLFVYSPVLLFAVAGAVIGWRNPLMRWCAIAAAADVILFARFNGWSGGQSFGPRLLSELLPLLAVLLVPALDRISGTRWRIVFGIALGWSVAVQLLAAATPAHTWFDARPIRSFGVWWHPLDNEIVTLATTDAMPLHVATMAAIVTAGALLGVAGAYAVEELSGSSRQPGASGRPAT